MEDVLKGMDEDSAALSRLQPPEMKRVLLVDDNDRYAAAIIANLEKHREVTVERATTARQGIEMLRSGLDRYDGLVTDISMEHQISGLSVLIAARRLKFKGLVIVATTGLDTPVAFALNRFLLGFVFGSNYLIPKRPIKRDGTVLWIPVRETGTTS